ncbi:MAG TPA: GDSL-type esterase/lipase family protein [Allosphingosinicella sp.]|nr:GDSL-type esterase/lipase family protein [Allosphingosinicella sp.]
MPFLSSLLAGGAAAAQSAALPPPVPALERREALAPFHAKLRAGRRVHILQLGDSHTSADAISNGLRAPLQAHFGAAGRGALAPGRPYDNYVTWQVTASQSAGWRVTSWNAPGAVPLGLSGFTQTARGAGETLGLVADAPEHEFNRLTVCAITGPGAGAVTLRLGTVEQSWALEAPRPGALCRSIESDVPVTAAAVTTLDERPVSLASIAVFRRENRGVTVSNLGQIGAQLSNFARGDEALVRAELAAWRPDLILLAFGTNEGFDPRFTLAGYDDGLRAQIARLRRLAGPDVPIVLVGPPAVTSRNAALAGAECGDGWYVPAFLLRVRERQRALARALGLAFWDWERAMGGRCAARAWHAAGLMRDDHIHFNRDGGDRIGRMLLADLMADFEPPAGGVR